MAGFTGSLQTNGYVKIPIADPQRGAVIAIVQWGFNSIGQAKISNDVEYAVSWPIAFRARY